MYPQNMQLNVVKITITILLFVFVSLTCYGEEPTDTIIVDTIVYNVGNRSLIERHYKEYFESQNRSNVIEYWTYNVVDIADSILEIQRKLKMLRVIYLPNVDNMRLTESMSDFRKKIKEYLLEKDISKCMDVNYSYGHISLLICQNGSIIPRRITMYTSLVRFCTPAEIIELFDKIIQYRFTAPVISKIQEDGYIIRTCKLYCNGE